jgi:predicted ATPase/DNA-binding CsgD family transcriptional regulator
MASNNLPVALTSFVGRERELAQASELLSRYRLLTLSGVGGVGKTRTAVQIAARLSGTFREGVCLVELAALNDANLLEQTILAALSVGESTRQSDRRATLIAYLRNREMLLVLDNCEHLVEGCARLVDALLKNCPHLRILATSREVLQIGGEAVLPLAPLAVPTPDLAVGQLGENEAVRLFRERAQTTRPDWQLTEQNAVAVAEICRELDGIPLALELAAARLKGLSAEQIAARLHDRFRLLAGGNRAALPHQQTLRGLVEWSYNLLPEREKIGLNRLAIFAGGWTVEAAETVAAGEYRTAHGWGVIEPGEVLDLLLELINKSLVVVENGTPQRYYLLETIRQYAAQKLAESGERETVAARHFDWCLDFAQTAEKQLQGAQQLEWLARLDAEYDNLRAALSKQPQAANFGELPAALGRYWYDRSRLEGADWLETALSQIDDKNVRLQIKIRHWLAMLLATNDYDRTFGLHQTNLSLARQLGDKTIQAQTLVGLGWQALFHGKFEQIGIFGQEALGLAMDSGDKASRLDALILLTLSVVATNAKTSVQQQIEEAFDLCRELGNEARLATVGQLRGMSELVQGNMDEGKKYLHESLRLHWKFRNLAGLPIDLLCLADIEVTNNPHRATVLLGVVQQIFEDVNEPIPPAPLAIMQQILATARAELGQEVYQKGLAEGRALRLEEVVALVLNPPDAKPLAKVETTTEELTGRELEVLREIAAGLSNAQIAQKLVISPRTVDAHLRSIYAKIGVTSRSAATRYALDHDLA